MNWNQNSGWGRALLDNIASRVPAMGNVMVVCASADTQKGRAQVIPTIIGSDYDGQIRFYTSLSAAYDACVTNNNDVIILDSVGYHDLTAGIAWSKNRIHVFGMDGGNHLVQQGAKVRLVTVATSAYVIQVTGVRNTFENIKFIQASTNAAALYVLQEGGEGSVYKNCSFVFEVATNLGGTTAHEVMAGSDSATYLDCTFGSDTLLTSGARSVFHIDQVTSGQEFKSNILRGCTFLISSSSSTAAFVRLDAITDILFTNLFDRCNFIASVDTAGGAAIAEVAQTGTGTNKGVLCFSYPAAFNVTAFATATGGRNAAIQVVAPTSVATTFKGINPTA